MKIVPVESLTAETRALQDALNNEPDFPCVLIVASFLDQCLAALLNRFLVESPVSDSLLRGPLNRFSNRARACFSLGLIPESLMKDLLTMAEIRNKFAHSYLSLSFQDAEVVQLVDSLQFPAVSEWVGRDAEAPQSEDPWANFNTPRVKFTIVAVSMASRLQLFALGAERRSSQLKGWS